jgi:hypothetical protein
MSINQSASIVLSMNVSLHSLFIGVHQIKTALLLLPVDDDEAKKSVWLDDEAEKTREQNANSRLDQAE